MSGKFKAALAAGIFMAALFLGSCAAKQEEPVQQNPASLSAHEYVKQGYDYYLKQEYDLALSAFTMAIAQDARYFEAYCYRGMAYYVKGDLDQAISDYTQAISLKPKDAIAYYDRGLAYERKGDWELALADFNQALKLDPDDAEARAEREETLKKLAELEQGKTAAPNIPVPNNPPTSKCPAPSLGDCWQACKDVMDACWENFDSGCGGEYKSCMGDCWRNCRSK